MFSGGERRCLRYLFLTAVVLTVLIIAYTPEHKIPLPKQVSGWELNVTRETKTYISPDNDTSIISGKQICGSPSLDVVIVVHSAPGNMAQRHAIRETWASHNETSVKVAFLLGWVKNVTLQLAIEEESNDYQDVIQEDFLDSYNNLTIKSVMMLKWYLGRCMGPRFLMKTDDDMYISVGELTGFLKRARSASNILVGSLICRARPILDANNKWYTPKYIYPKAFYPNYLSGTAYVMSRDVAYKLYLAALSTALIHLEDVYITGMCASKAGVKPRNDPSFSYDNFGVGCLASMITNHRLSPRQLYQASDKRLIKEARASFPSGHASLMSYAMVYLTIYLQKGVAWSSRYLVKSGLQFSFIAICWFTALSRVSDYHHHSTDVLVGLVFGITIAYLSTRCMSKLCGDHLLSGSSSIQGWLEPNGLWKVDHWFGNK